MYPSPRQISSVNCLFWLKSCPGAQWILSATRLPSSEPGSHDKASRHQTLGVRVCEFAFIQRQAAFTTPAGRELSHTCNSPLRPHPHPEKLPVNVLKIPLQKEPRPHTKECMNHIFSIKITTEMKIFLYSPPPHAATFTFIFLRREEGSLREVLPGAFFSMKEVTSQVGSGVPSAT